MAQVIQGWFPAGERTRVPAAFAALPQRGGEPLSPAVRQTMERFFATSFADVRVHVGPQAAAAGAAALTQGSHLHFAPGHYDPLSPRGQQLLARQLAHVVQQRAGRVRAPHGPGPAIVRDRALDAEADRVVQRFAVVQATFWGGVTGAFAGGGLFALGGALIGSVVPVVGTAIGGAAGGIVGAAVGGYAGHRYTEPPPVFRNRLPHALGTEIGRYLAEWRRNRHRGNDEKAYVLVYPRDGDEFKKKVREGQRFLWTYSVQGHLSIGSPTQNQHSVVGAGRDVYAAGAGQYEISDEEDRYRAYFAIRAKAEKLRAQGFTDPSDNPYIEQAEFFRMDPPQRGPQHDVVVLNFESGHYHPRNAWTKTIEGWRRAGFTVKKDTSGHTA